MISRDIQVNTSERGQYQGTVDLSIVHCTTVKYDVPLSIGLDSDGVHPNTSPFSTRDLI